MNQTELERMASDIDRVEADLVCLQSRLWSVRQRLQKMVGRPVGFQYDDADGKSVPLREAREGAKG